MERDSGNEALADSVIALFKMMFSKDVVIGRSRDGKNFEIETDAGASFTFEITGATRSEVALRYFEHIRSVYKFVVENRRSGSWLDGGHRYSREEKVRARRCLAVLDTWAAEHLKP